MNRRTPSTGWRTNVRRALGTGAVVGVLVGVREGLETLDANAFADAQHHAFAYLVTPIAVWFVLGPLLLLPVAGLASVAGGLGIPAYAGILSAEGTLLALLPTLEDTFARMQESGAAPTLAMQVAIVGFALAIAIGVGAVVRAALCRHLERGGTLFRRAPAIATAIGCAALVWSGRFLATSLAPPAAHASGAVTGAVTAPADAPNVVVISIDTLRADELGAYGGRDGLTPALDRFAAEGVTFEQAISPAPWTLPSLASLMTGLYPRHHGAGAIVNRHDPLGRSPLAPGVPTIAEAFVRHGYRTQAFVTNPYLLTRSGLGSGYQGYENLTFLSEAMIAGRRNAAQWLLDHLAPQLVAGDRGTEVSDRAVRWLAENGRRQPFFLWLHYLDPHGPYGRADGTRHKSFRGETTFGATATAGADISGRSPDPVRLRSGEIRLGDDEKAAMRTLYRGEVAEVDRQIGRVLDAVDAVGLADRTLVVCVSDHGEEFWDHGGVEHGHTLYDELLHVVLMMRWPSQLPAGKRVGSVVSTVDVAPTLLALANLDETPATDGRSLRPDIDGNPGVPRAVLSENLLFAEERISIRTETAKLVRWANGKEEAYDLASDPLERRDLAGVESFTAPLRTTLVNLEAGLAPAVSPTAGENLPAAALRSLGYLQ